MNKEIEVACIVEETEAEGPGKRFGLWTQGCPIRCEHCCNPEYFKVGGGTKMSVPALFGQIVQAQKKHGIEGISVLGGEPMIQSEALAELFWLIKEFTNLTIMVYTGYYLAELSTGSRVSESGRDSAEDSRKELLQYIDLLVDGPYDHAQPDTARRWVGSQNQTTHFLTDAYQEDDPQFLEETTVEIRLVQRKDGKIKLQVNGYPWADHRRLF